jgi:hypothetical protein
MKLLIIYARQIGDHLVDPDLTGFKLERIRSGMVDNVCRVKTDLRYKLRALIVMVSERVNPHELLISQTGEPKLVLKRGSLG